MIRVKLSPGMLPLVTEEAIDAAGVATSERAAIGGEPQVLALAAAFDAAAAALEGVKGKGNVRRVALAAAQRCRSAIEHAHEIAARPIHVSIPVAEQEAITALAASPAADVAPDVLERLYRRTLAEESPAGWDLTARGLALAAGTPPGDLVPFEHFAPGVRVKLAADLVLEEGGELPAGRVLEVVEARDRRLTVYDGERQIAGCHPLIFFVLRGEG